MPPRSSLPSVLDALPTGLNLPFADEGDTGYGGFSIDDQLAAIPDPIANMMAPDGSDDIQSIIGNLPASIQRFTKKYTTLAEQSMAAGVDPMAYNAVLQYDAQRVARGSQPLNTDQTKLALAAAQQQAAITQPPQTSLFDVPGNAIGDIKTIVQAIPKLPMALWDEVQQLPNVFSAISRNQAAGMNPVTAIASAPGVRMIPGSFVIGQAARGPEGLEELARHPVMTALDVLPAAGKIAEGTKVGQAAAEAGMRPLRGALTRSLDETGALVPNRAGQLGQALMDTRLGQNLQQAFGKDSRTMSTMAYTANQRAMEMLQGVRSPEQITSDPARRAMITTARKAHALRQEQGLKEFGIGREEIPAITETMMDGNWRDNPDIPDNVKGFIGYSQQLTDQFGSQMVDQGLLGEFKGEYYDLPTANRLNTAQTTLSRRQAKVRNYTIPRLQQVAGDNPRINGLIDMLGEAADPANPTTLAAANKELTAMMRQTGGKSPFSATQQASVDLIRNTVRQGHAAEKVVERVSSRTAPRRFQPMIRTAADRQLGEYYIARGADPEVVGQAIVDRNYALLDEMDVAAGKPAGKLRMDFIDDIKGTWQKMRDKGADPVFVHHISPEQADRLDYVKTFPGPTSVSQTKSATYTPSAYVKDITVALDHQGHEILRRLASDDFMTQFMGTFGRSENELLQRYMPQARSLAARSNGATDALTHANSLMRREYTPFEPSSYVNWSGAKVTGLDPERTWIPKALADNVKLMYGDQDVFAKLLAPLQPITSAYRTAVLPLSPRFHTNNFFNNLIQMNTTLDPTVMTKFGRARDLFKAVREGTDTEVLIPDELRAELARGAQKDLYAPTKFAAGSTMGRWWQQIQEGKGAGAARAVDAAGNVLDKVTTKSFDLFETTEGIMRSMAYLYGYDKSLAKGLTKDAAARAGLETTYKTIQDLAQLTPIERSIIRNVIPFYGYMQHLGRYLINFPGDHPYRAAIFSAMARMEMDDHQTALPETLRNMIPIGQPDESGNQRAISLQGLNPFSDAGDLFTFAGFVSAMNPVFKTLAQQLGLDPFTGSADLHPNVHYDPSTGAMKLDAGNPLTQLAYNVIPQSQILGEIAGTNREFHDLLRTDPATAQRMLASQAGLPVSLRNINLPQGYVRTELARAEDRQAVLTDALKTGDDSQAKLWPGLQGLVNQVRTLQTGGQLSPYSPTAVSPGAAQVLFHGAQQAIQPQTNQLPDFARQYQR